MKDIVYAKAKYVRRSPRKVRLVVDMIRGKKAEDAATNLQFLNKAAAGDVLKVLNSAIANAENNNEWNKEELMIKEAFVDEAPTYKRGRAVARGSYHPILKRNSHITIGLVEKESGKAKSKTSKKVQKKEKYSKKKKTKKTETKTKTKAKKSKSKKSKTKKANNTSNKSKK